MSASGFAMIEMAIFATIALGLGFWQLWSVNRDIRRRQEQDQADDQSR